MTWKRRLRPQNASSWQPFRGRSLLLPAPPGFPVLQTIVALAGQGTCAVHGACRSVCRAACELSFSVRDAGCPRFTLKIHPSRGNLWNICLHFYWQMWVELLKFFIVCFNKLDHTRVAVRSLLSFLFVRTFSASIENAYLFCQKCRILVISLSWTGNANNVIFVL